MTKSKNNCTRRGITYMNCIKTENGLLENESV